MLTRKIVRFYGLTLDFNSLTWDFVLLQINYNLILLVYKR
jgi:hypothetical protein